MLLSIPHARVPPHERLRIGRALSLCREMGGGCVKISSVLWVGVSAVGNLPGKMLHRKSAAGHFRALRGAESQRQKGNVPLTRVFITALPDRL